MRKLESSLTIFIFEEKFASVVIIGQIEGSVRSSDEFWCRTWQNLVEGALSLHISLHLKSPHKLCLC
jgi:hypothetical protein